MNMCIMVWIFGVFYIIQYFLLVSIGMIGTIIGGIIRYQGKWGFQPSGTFVHLIIVGDCGGPLLLSPPPFPPSFKLDEKSNEFPHGFHPSPFSNWCLPCCFLDRTPWLPICNIFFLEFFMLHLGPNMIGVPH